MDNQYPSGTICPQIENLEKITPEQAAEYVRFVALLRDNQRQFFQFRNPEILETCKRLEKQLDVLNKRLLDPMPKLF